MGLMTSFFRRYTEASWPVPSPCGPAHEDPLECEDSWEGPDDLWPDEEAVLAVPEPQIAYVKQWGLQLPDGTISWGSWQGVSFDNPLDRLRMIATLQKTAQNVGFAEGEQIERFLDNYGWIVRDAAVTTQFSAVRASYRLNDPVAAEITTNGTPEKGEDG